MWTRCGRGINTGNMDIEVTWRRARGGDAGHIDQVFDNEIMPLIVAAPELLEACRKFIMHKHIGDLHPVDYQRIEQAIEKAEGR